MSWVDLGLVIVLGSFAANGAFHGFIHQVCGLLGLGLGLAVAVRFYQPVAQWLRIVAQASLATEAIAFAMLLLLVWSVAQLAGVAMRAGLRDDAHAWPDVLGGTFLGVLTGILLLAILIVGLDLLGIPGGSELASSHVGAWLLSLAQGLFVLFWGS